jgi:hypothetical protein
MNDQQRTKISLHDPGELIAAIPYLIGYHPTESLIAVLLSDLEEARVIGAVGTELPTDVPNLAYGAELLRMARSFGASAVIVVVVSGGASDGSDEPPHRPLFRAIERVLRIHQIQVGHSAWAQSTRAGSTWCCYGQPTCRGAVPAGDSTAIGAANAARGRVVYGSSDELDATLAPDDEAALAARALAILERIHSGTADEFLAPARAWERVKLVRATLDQIAAGSWQPDNDAFAELAFALLDHRVGSICLGLSLQEDAGAAEQLWRRLTQALPLGFRARAAFLLAATTYAQGDAITANLALRVAREADPELEEASLLHDALSVGIRPEEFAEMMAAARRNAERAIAEDDGAESQ